ncbi:MAG: hypothetical protein JO291_14550 [Acidimicrobiia bacterium]|nr:hypothetical protein [Acidimicrobiia bacterium]
MATGVAALCALAVIFFAWHGSDLPAQTYRVSVFRQYGWLTFDMFWYSGHYLITYSFLTPAFAGALGLRLVGWLGAATAAGGFSRLATAHVGKIALPASLVFAAGTAVPLLIGEITFLTGFAIGLWALVAVDARRRALGPVLALGATLASPLAGLFLLLTLTAWAVAYRDGRLDRLLAASATAVPLTVSALAFHEVGVYDFSAGQLVAVLICSAVGWWAVPAHMRAIRTGLILYGILGVGLFVVQNPVGGNLVRLGAYLAPALAVIACWPRRSRLLVVLLVPALIWQWSSGVTALSHARGDPTRDESYFQPLVRELARLPGPARVEIPPTSQHWEATYVATHVPLARGWERQIDVARNPLFYGDRLTATAYRRWLYANGVTWVALSDATSDPAGEAEAALIRRGLPYLRPTWTGHHWQVWKVSGSPGLLTGAARLDIDSPAQFTLVAQRPTDVVVRFRYTRTWVVAAGRACIQPAAGGWTRVRIRSAGAVVVSSRLFAHHSGCPDEEPTN